MFLKGSGFPNPSPAGELKTIALLIVLIRAGLAIKFDEIKAKLLSTVLLSIVPFFAEFFCFMYASLGSLDGWSSTDAGLFASVMAPLGPSVVISGMLMLMANPKNKDYGHIPQQIVISAPLEAVIAIVLFGIFASLEQTTVPPLFPWVKVYPLWVNILLIPVNLLFSTVLGIISGWIVSKYMHYRIKVKTDYIWVRVSKNPQMGMMKIV
jgi:NhaP-type Na+/H+ or K+/H+ antiporter